MIREKRGLFKIAVIMMLAGFLLGIDAFTYSNPIVKSANLYYNNKDYKKALKLFKEAGKKVEDKKTINFNIAGAYYKMGEFKKALEYFERSLIGDDNAFNAKVMFNMGDSYFKQGELKKAYGKYKSALKLNPKNVDAKYNLEFVLSMMEQNRKRKEERKRDRSKNARKRDGSLKGENSFNSPSEMNRDNSTANEDYNSNAGDFDARDDLEDISKDDALRILSTLTEQVSMRVPMRKDHLTKKGEHNEKDW